VQTRVFAEAHGRHIPAQGIRGLEKGFPAGVDGLEEISAHAVPLGSLAWKNDGCFLI